MPVQALSPLEMAGSLKNSERVAGAILRLEKGQMKGAIDGFAILPGIHPKAQ
jgi:hypothetical protein